MDEITAGTILVAEPFLKDPNFLRTAIFICEHHAEGSLGFVLNRVHREKVGDLIPGLDDCIFPLYYGGPVQVNTIHFLHQCPGLITGGIEITDGIFWGGELEEVIELISNNKINATQLRFFLGYSGWGENQLYNEWSEKTWLLTEGNKRLVFHRQAHTIWREALKQMGGEYTQMINYPIDPQLN